MNIATSLGRAAGLVAAAVFAVAGAAKLFDLESTRLSIGRLLPGSARPPRWTLTATAAALGVAEVVVGVLMVLAPRGPVVVVAAAFTVCFIGAVVSAQRRGLACGCFGSLLTGTTGPAELRRAVAMCCLASTAAAARYAFGAGRVTPALVAVGSVVCATLLIVVSVDRTSRPGSAARLALAGRAPDRGGWRRTTPWTRASIIRSVRADAVTAEVTTHPGIGRPSWRSARVRTRRIGAVPVASVVARAEGGVVQALWRRGVPAAVVGYTRSGVVLPASASRSLDAPRAGAVGR